MNLQESRSYIMQNEKNNCKIIRTLQTQQGLPNEIKIKEKKYIGHIKRRNNILKTILEEKGEGKKRRDRQEM